MLKKVPDMEFYAQGIASGPALLVQTVFVA